MHTMSRKFNEIYFLVSLQPRPLLDDSGNKLEVARVDLLLFESYFTSSAEWMVCGLHWSLVKHPAGAGMLVTFVFPTVIGLFLPVVDCHWSNPINCGLSLDHTITWIEQPKYLEGLLGVLFTWAYIPFCSWLRHFPSTNKFQAAWSLTTSYWKKFGFILFLFMKDCLSLRYKIWNLIK